MNIGIIGVLRQCVHSVLWLWKISDWLTTGAVQEFWFWLLPFVPTAFWDSLSVPGVSQVELQTKTKLHRQQQAGSLSWCTPLSPSSPAALPAIACDGKMAWNSTEPWRASDVECQSRVRAISDLPRGSSVPEDLSVLALLLFCVMPLEELIQQPGGGDYCCASDTQICILLSQNRNSSLSTDAVRLEQQAGTWLITKCKHRKDPQAACATVSPCNHFRIWHNLNHLPLFQA